MNETKRPSNIFELAEQHADKYFIFLEDDEKLSQIPADRSVKFKTQFDPHWLQAEDFEVLEKGYKIKCDDVWYFIDIIDRPQDRFGNVATYENGIELEDNCRVVYFKDDRVELFASDFPYSEYIYNNNYKRLFYEWFIEERNFTYYDFIAEIYEDGIIAVKLEPLTELDESGGRLMSIDSTYQDFTYITTNVDFDSEQWQTIFNHFEIDLKASTKELPQLENCKKNDFPYPKSDDDSPIESYLGFDWEKGEKENKYYRELSDREMAEMVAQTMMPRTFALPKEDIEKIKNGDDLYSIESLNERLQKIAQSLPPSLIPPDYKPGVEYSETLVRSLDVLRQTPFIPKVVAEMLWLENQPGLEVNIDDEQS